MRGDLTRRKKGNFILPDATRKINRQDDSGLVERTAANRLHN